MCTSQCVCTACRRPRCRRDEHMRTSFCVQGKPALAFSFDNYKATAAEDYEACAAACVPLVRAVLDRLRGDAAFLDAMRGNVLNINLPFGQPRGYYLARMGTSCVMARFADAPPQRRAKALQGRGVATDDGSVRVLEGVSPAFQKCAAECGRAGTAASFEPCACAAPMSPSHALSRASSGLACAGTRRRAAMRGRSASGG